MGMNIRAQKIAIEARLRDVEMTDKEIADWWETGQVTFPDKPINLLYNGHYSFLLEYVKKL
jgi:hypothetical protein